MLGDLLDVEDQAQRLFKAEWELEVGSPGVDRPLTKRSHFADVIGSRVKLKTRLPVEGQRSFDGRLLKSEEAGVTIAVADKEPVLIPWTEVHTAHVVFEFESKQKPTKPPKAHKPLKQKKPEKNPAKPSRPASGRET